VARILVVSAPLFDPGDLERRIPAGRKVLLTQNQPSVVAPQEEFSPSAPTVMSASAAMRAALIEAARTRGNGVPVPAPSDEATINRAELLETGNKNPLSSVITDAGVEPLLAKCFKKSDTFYPRINLIDIAKTDSRALTGSIQTFDAGRMLDTMRLLTQPICVIHGGDDPIIPQPNEDVLNYLTLDKEQLTLPILLPGVRHFPMLEDERFVSLSKDFLEAPDLSKVALKERWRRRTR
jgi:pimeloyl-ACP methyl ester carboxylesterase